MRLPRAHEVATTNICGRRSAIPRSLWRPQITAAKRDPHHRIPSPELVPRSASHPFQTVHSNAKPAIFSLCGWVGMFKKIFKRWGKAQKGRRLVCADRGQCDSSLPSSTLLLFHKTHLIVLSKSQPRLQYLPAKAAEDSIHVQKTHAP